MLMDKKRKKRKNELPRYKRILRYWCWNLSKGLRLRERVEYANRWSLEHPRQFMRITVGTGSFLLVITVFSLAASMFQRGEETQQDGAFVTNAVQDIQPVMNGMRQIRNRQKVENHELKNLTERGLQIKDELDSLLAIEDKTHEDSARIVADYRQLEDIVNFLKTDKK